jgi:hypothetical protein
MPWRSGKRHATIASQKINLLDIHACGAVLSGPALSLRMPLSGAAVTGV